MPRPDQRLWDVDHPYYWNEGNHHRRGLHGQFDTFVELVEYTADWDLGMKLLVRWDWQHWPDDPDEPYTFETHWVGQHKSTTWSLYCAVTPEDEPAVRAWLAPRYARLVALWQPLPFPDADTIARHLRDEV